MTIHLNDNQITRYQNGQFDATELAALDAHIQNCPPCAARLLTPLEMKRATKMLLSEWNESPVHLSFEMLKEYVDQRASEEVRRTVEGHTAFCARCRNDLQNLREFHATMSDETVALNRMAAEVAEQMPAPVRATTRKTPFWIGGGVLSGAVASCLLLWVAVISPLRLAEKVRVSELAQITKENNDLRQAIRTTPSQPNIQPTPDKTLALLAEAVKDKDSLKKDRDRLKNAYNQSEANRKLADNRADKAEALQKSSHDRVLTLEASNAKLTKLANAKQQSSKPNDAISDMQKKMVANNWNSNTPFHISGNPANSVAMRGGELTPQEPVQITVLSNLPTLRWSGTRDVKQYEVRVFRLRQNQPEANSITSGTVAGDAESLSWQVDKPLERGGDYEWQLYAVHTNNRREKAPVTGHFHVASNTTLQQHIQQWKQQAVLAAQDGLYKESINALTNIIEANPDKKTKMRATQMRNDLRKQHGDENN